jgi:GT2 family glycosyltransferase
MAVDDADADADRGALHATVDSVIAQIDRRWQLVLVGDRAEEIRAALPRDVRIVAQTAAGDMAAHFNAAAAAARGAYVAVIAVGDLLLPHAVRTIGRATAASAADILYGDEMDCSKPDWSPDLLLAFPYTGRICAIARDAVARFGGWTADTLAADDYRLLLAAARAGARIRRLGDIVCRRAVPGRVALVSAAAVEARRRALVEHFAATGEPARVEHDNGPSRLRVVWPIDGQPLVSIVIPTRDRLALLRRCIESIERRSIYPAYEIVIVDNDSVEPATLDYFATARHRVVKVPGDFNFSRINNEGARAARGEFVVFLNNDTEVLAPGWIEEMLQQARRPGVGAVGAKLLFGNGRVQHAGVVLHDGSAFHLAYEADAAGGASWPWIDLVRDTSAVTGACLMIHRQRFLDEGGFDETFPVNYNDIELCVRLMKRGYRHVYTPYATLYHHESSSRPRGVAADEARHLRAVCGSILWNDPFCPRIEERGTPRWTLDTGAGRTLMRAAHASTRGWRALRAAGSRPRPLFGVRPLASDGDADAIRWMDRVEIRGEVRPALFMHPAAQRTWRIPAPRGARLEAWIAIMPEVWGQNLGGVRFRVTVSTPGGPSRTRAWHVDPSRHKAHRAWVPIAVPLRAPAGGTVDLTLATEVPPRALPMHAWAVWGQPMITERRPLHLAVTRQVDIVRRLGWRAAAGRALRVMRGTSHPFVMYDAWFRDQAVTARESRDIPADLARLSYRPRISVLTPVYNTPPDLLQLLIDSVRAQWYPDWQLCLADDASTRAETRAMLDGIDGSDPRIRVVRQSVNGGISAATNAALDAADGEFVALLDHDDEIAPDALLEVVELLNRHPDADVVYTDEDKLDFDGTHVEPFFKPDWSPEYLNSTMFLGHLVVYRRAIVEAAGRFRSAFDGSQDYDLALRVAERTDRIHHVPRVLYHWRKIQGSAAASADAKPWGLQAARRALVDHVSRLPMRATVEDQPGDGFWRVRYEIVGTPKVTVIIPTAGAIRETPMGTRDMALACLRSIVQRTDYPHYDIVLALNGQLSDELSRFIAGEPRVRTIASETAGPFNFAATINRAARQATGDHLLLLNDDTEVISPEWMRAMLEFSQQREIGAVGARLLFPDGRLQHIGVIVGIGGGACHVMSGLPGDSPGYFGGAWIIRNYSAVTAACLMTRRNIFEDLGGFDERFATDFNDVDYCLRAREAGYRIVVTPFATLHHFEGASFGSRERKVNPLEVRLMSERWAGVIAHDPYYNPNLTRTALDYSLRL